MRPMLILMFMLIATPALATDGVLEINQTCAENTGCFVGDGALFPVTIGAAGSYRLTSNLAVDENTSAIIVDADHVTVDLNGFAILGPAVCSGTPTICSSTGSGRGVRMDFGQPWAVNTTVLNGTIQGMGDRGIQLGNHALVRGVRVSNGQDGINANSGSSFIDNIASWNGRIGIVGAGFEGCVIKGNAANENGLDGIIGAADCVISGNTASGNAQRGISVNTDATLVGNTVNDNAGIGIEIRGGALRGNTVIDNGSFGLDGEPEVGYGENVFEGNNGGNANAQVTGGGIEIGTNLCGTNTTCP